MNLLKIGLAFLEGLALIASPCILPVLPLVLSASTSGGRKRPFGIVLGFAAAFTTFALLSRELVTLLHIDPDVIKYASLALLFVFGLVMISGRLSERFSTLTQGAAGYGGRLAGGAKGGFGSGLAIGALIGLVWTPCAGPILAVVLVQVIREKSSLDSVFLIFAFALGAGVPMLLISLLGRGLVNKLGFLAGHAEVTRKALGILIVASVLFLASGIDIRTVFTRAPKTAAGSGARLQNGLKHPYPAPEFAGIANWINSKPLTMRGLRGKVVLVDFWTYSCINCVRTLPYLVDWDKKYRADGLVIVGVHSPEFEFEKNLDNVKNAVRRRGIQYPVALDSDLGTWTNYNNEYWPAHYLIDKTGKVVYTHFGEGDYDITENNIRYLLGINGKATGGPAPETDAAGQTPETYLGYDRAERFAGKARHDAVAAYTFPHALRPNGWALDGKWKIETEKIDAEAPGASLRLRFKARKVFLVLGVSGARSVPVSVTLNGAAPGAYSGADAPGGKFTVAGHSLFELIDQKTVRDGTVEIRAGAPGLEAYAFTFGG